MTIGSSDVKLEDLEYDEVSECWQFDCVCGSQFVFFHEDLRYEIEYAFCARCPRTCKVIYAKDSVQ